MQSAGAAAVQSSGSRKRCISSLQVTYHQEIHRPAPRLAPCSYPPTASTDSYGLVDVDQQAVGEGEYSQETGRPVPEEGDFYDPNSSHWEPPLITRHAAVGPGPISPATLPPPLTVPHSPLYSLEDGLRQRVNVEIENFRASLQGVMREEFVSQRNPHYSHHNLHMKEEEMQEHSLDVNHSNHDEAGQSVETSIDSGVCMEATPTPGVEEELSLALIRLQTLTAAITANLLQAGPHN